jgi:hypothetical protein
VTRTRRRTEEADIQGQIVKVAEALGYLTWHDYDSRRNAPGFPDLWILGYGRLLVLELKAGRNTTTAEQSKWLAELCAAGVDARLYHVSEWRGRKLADELTATARAWRRGERGRTTPRRQEPQHDDH